MDKNAVYYKGKPIAGANRTLFSSEAFNNKSIDIFVYFKRSAINLQTPAGREAAEEFLRKKFVELMPQLTVQIDTESFLKPFGTQPDTKEQFFGHLMRIEAHEVANNRIDISLSDSKVAMTIIKALESDDNISQVFAETHN